MRWGDTGRHGDQTAAGSQQHEPPGLSARERAGRGRPGERSRAALADVAVETENTLAGDIAALDPALDPLSDTDTETAAVTDPAGT